jgi:hypothetical protein
MPIRARGFTFLLMLASVVPTLARAEPPSRTEWVLAPSEAFDALCFLNVLRGDPFYVQEHAQTYATWSPRLGPAEKRALAHLTRRMQVQAQQIVSARLTLAFSAAPIETVADLVALVDDDRAWDRMRATFRARGDDFHDVDDVRPDLRLLLRFLVRSGYVDDWRTKVRPHIEAVIAEQRALLSRYDVVGLDERVLGRRLDPGPITAYFLGYVRPHGIRIRGWRFLTDVDQPFRTTVKTALHELLHPPFARTGALDKQLRALEADPYYQRLVREHDPAFGYRTADGLTEEDCAEAIDVFNSERLGLIDDVPAYFRDHDDGMHVLAFILYQELKRADWPRWTTFEDFLSTLFRQGKLRSGALAERFASYPGHYPVRALR